MHTRNIRRAMFAAGTVACMLGQVPNAAYADPPAYKTSCQSILVSGTSVTIDILQGTVGCRRAGQVIGTYARGKHAPRTLVIDGIRWTCNAAGPKTIKKGAAWRYLCHTKGYAAMAGGSRLIAPKYYVKDRTAL